MEKFRTISSAVKILTQIRHMKNDLFETVSVFTFSLLCPAGLIKQKKRLFCQRAHHV